MHYLSEDNQQTMSSREIATYTNKRHDNVLRDIRDMLSELGLDALKFEGIYIDPRSREKTEYRLTRRLTDCLLTGYSAVARLAVIDRWTELENGVAQVAAKHGGQMSNKDIEKLVKFASDQAVSYYKMGLSETEGKQSIPSKLIDDKYNVKVDRKKAHEIYFDGTQPSGKSVRKTDSGIAGISKASSGERWRLRLTGKLKRIEKRFETIEEAARFLVSSERALGLRA